MKLIDQVKPEILEILEKDVKTKYNSSYKLIIATFSKIELSIIYPDCET